MPLPFTISHRERKEITHGRKATEICKYLYCEMQTRKTNLSVSNICSSILTFFGQIQFFFWSVSVDVPSLDVHKL